MKTNQNGKQNTSHSKTTPSKRPENKDNLDSREKEEQLAKGDDITHNQKEKHSNTRNK